APLVRAVLLQLLLVTEDRAAAGVEPDRTLPCGSHLLFGGAELVGGAGDVSHRGEDAADLVDAEHRPDEAGLAVLTAAEPDCAEDRERAAQSADGGGDADDHRAGRGLRDR